MPHRLEEIALRRRLQDAVLAAQNRGDRAAALTEATLTQPADQPRSAERGRGDRDRDADSRVAVSVYGETRPDPTCPDST